jgi:tyrosyl-tRNA synthetase
LSVDEIMRMREAAKSGNANPRDFKVQLAKRIITDFHSAGAAEVAEEDFVRRFRNKETPEEVEERALPASDPRGWDLSRMLVTVGLAESKADARRLIQQGGVYVNGERQMTVNAVSLYQPGMTTVLLKVGKRRYVRVNFT